MKITIDFSLHQYDSNLFPASWLILLFGNKFVEIYFTYILSCPLVIIDLWPMILNLPVWPYVQVKVSVIDI